MKTILGVFAVSVVLFTACGGDGGSTDSSGGPGNEGGSSAAGADSGNETQGGEAGKSTAPHGGETSEGGTTLTDGGTGDAIGGGRADGGAPAPTNSPVTGHIFSMSGIPLEGAVVTIEGESTLTDADGTFSFDDVPAKYDVTVIYSNESANVSVAELVDGLTTRDLSLRLWPVRNDTSSASVLGSLSTPVAKGHEAIVQLVGEHVSTAFDSLAAGAIDYDLELVWEGGGKGAADIVGLEWATGVSGPSSYTGYARKHMQAMDGTGIIANLTLTKPAQKTVVGTLTADGPTPPDSFIGFGPMLVPLAIEAGAFSVVVPEVGVTPVITVGAKVDDAYATMKAPASLKPLALEIPAAPKLILPINKAQVDLSTEFAFTRPGNLAVVWWALGPWMVVHVTDQTKLKLPDLRVAGIVFDIGNDSAPWAVETYGPAATPEEFLALMDGTSLSLESDRTTYSSATRSLYLAK